MSIDVTIHEVTTGTCCLSLQKGEGLRVSFSDKTIEDAFVSQKMFFQLIKLKASQNGKEAEALPVEVEEPEDG